MNTINIIQIRNPAILCILSERFSREFGAKAPSLHTFLNCVTSSKVPSGSGFFW